MRNLRKLTAAVLAVALVLTSMTAAFAATTVVNADKAATMKSLDLYAGKDPSDPAIGLEDALTTQDSLIFLAKLFGYNDAASKLTATEVSKALAKFADASSISDYAKNVVAYSAINGIVSGSTKDGKFFVGAKDTVTAARFATFMLKQMGYTVADYKASAVQLSEVDGSKVSATETGDLTRDAAVGIMYGALTAEKAAGTTVIADIVGTDAAKKAIASKAGLLVATGTLAIDSVTVTGAKKLTVKFGTAVDKSKAVVTVKKGGVSVNIASTTFSTDNTSAVIELSGKVAKGDYTVSVSGLTDTALTGTVTAADEKVQSIELGSSAIYVDTTHANVYYKVLNQYAEDITKTASLTVASSATGPAPNYSLDAAKGVCTLNFTAVKIGDSVAITLINTDAAVSAAKTLVVTEQAGAKEMTIDSLYNADGKTLSEDSTYSDFKLVINAKDQYGNKLNATDLSSNLIVSVSDTTVVKVNNYNPTANTATFTTTKIDGVDTVTLALAAPTTPKDGTAKISLISKTTGKSAYFDVVVKDGVITDTISLTAPDIAAVREDAVIQVNATDKDGVAINKVSEFATGTTVNVTSTGGTSAQLTNAFKLNPTTNKVELVIPQVNLGSQKGKATVTVMSETNKVVILQLDVKDEAVPTTFVGFKSTSDVVPNLYISGSVTIDTDDIIVEDQYGRQMSASKINASLGSDVLAASTANIGKSIITFESDNAAVDAVDNLTTTVVTSSAGFTAGNTTNVTFTAAGTKGAANITAKIFVGAATTGAYTLVTGSNFDYAMGVKDKTQIVSYEVKALGSMYENPALAYNKIVKVYGVLSNGTKVQIPSSLYTITTDNSSVTVSGSSLVAANTTVDTDHKDVTVNINVIVDADASTVQLTAPVIVSDAAPKAVTLKTASTTFLTVDGLGVTGNVSNITKAKLLALVTTVDQYGTEDATTVGINNPTLTITNISAGSTVVVTNNGTTGATFTAPTAGDSFDLTLAYGSKTITFKVVAQ